jgi:KTSC domain
MALGPGWDRVSQDLQGALSGSSASPSKWAEAYLSVDPATAAADLTDQRDQDPNFDVSDFYMAPTTSTNPDRPRTLKAGYNIKTQTLYVVFRKGVWWEYRNVPPKIWEEFKAAESKGKYMQKELDTWPDMGKAIITNMTKAQRVQLNNDLQQASKLYKE